MKARADRLGRASVAPLLAAFLAGALTLQLAHWLGAPASNRPSPSFEFGPGALAERAHALAEFGDAQESAALLQAALIALERRPTGARDLWTALRLRADRDGLTPQEELGDAAVFAATLDGVLASARTDEDLEALHAARGAAEERRGVLRLEIVADSVARLQRVVQELQSIPIGEALLRQLTESGQLGPDSDLFLDEDLVAELTFNLPAEPFQELASASREVADLVWDAGDASFESLRLELTQLLESSREPGSVGPVEEGQLGAASQIIARLGEVIDALAEAPVAELPGMDSTYIAKRSDALTEGTEQLFDAAMEALHLRYDTWALARIYGAQSSSYWPEELASVEPGRLASGVGALYTTTLSERLAALTSPRDRYEHVVRQLSTQAVDISRF